MNWEKKQADTSAIIGAKIELRKAAHIVADCPYCMEGWRDTGNGVTRCECYSGQYVPAFEYLRNLDSNFFVEDSMTDFKPARLHEDECVSLSQIRELRDSIERMATRKGVEL